MRAVSCAVFATAFVLSIHAGPAAAQVLTFVSATGSDANSCTVQASPCRTLPRAILVSAAGGEIRLLSQISGGNALLTKSLTIDGGGHTLIGTISINSASAIVTLRNLSLTGRGTVARGINIVNAAVVHIENCTVERFTEEGINAAASISAELFVSATVSRDNSSVGLNLDSPSNVKLVVENSRFANNAFGIIATGDGAAVSVTDSIFSGNSSTGFSLQDGRATIARTMFVSNGYGINLVGGDLTVDSIVSRGNTGDGILVGSIGDTVARLSNSVITNNLKGVELFLEGGIVLTRGDNVIAANGTNLDPPGLLTPLAGQ